MNIHDCTEFTTLYTEHEEVCSDCGVVLNENAIEERLPTSLNSPLYEKMLGSENLVPKQISKSRFLADTLQGYPNQHFRKIRNLCSALQFGDSMTRRTLNLFWILTKYKIQGSEAAYFSVYQTCSEFTKPHDEKRLIAAVMESFNAKRPIRPKHVMYTAEWCLIINNIPFDQNRTKYLVACALKDMDVRSQKAILEMHDKITTKKGLNISAINAAIKWRIKQ